MAFIEYKDCIKHGEGNHTDGKCWKCGEEEAVIKEQVKDSARKQFFLLSQKDQIAYLFNKLE